MTKELSVNTASKVRKALEDIKKRLDDMTVAKDAGPRTNGIFHWNGRENQNSGNNGIPINKIQSISLLISILGFLLTRKEEYDKAANLLDMNPFPVFKWSNYPIDAWENDIKSQINLITHSSEIEKLTKLRDELSKYVTEEDRVNSLLAQIEKG